MLKPVDDLSFATINHGYNTVFRPERLSVGLVAPLESYPNSPIPALTRQRERIRLADELGFSAIWLRDVPFNVPSFGDAGQVHDPFVYLGHLAGLTERIALGVASIVLPLRHPAQVAKAAASVDALSGGRLLLGVASGDRPEEYPAMAVPFEERGQRFRESFGYIRAMAGPFPQYGGAFGTLSGAIDMLPKPTSGRLPLLITGSSRQDPAWVAVHGDGWMTYPRPLPVQAQAIEVFRATTRRAEVPLKPVMQPLYFDLNEDIDAPPQPIHLGFRSGLRALSAYLKALEGIGVNHVALNLRFNRAGTENTLRHLAETILPEFQQ